MAIVTRRTLTRTSAPIFSSFSRMVPQVAWANWVWAGPIGEQVELALLDAIFHLAACAIHRLVEMPRADLGAFQRGDDEARIGVPTGPLGLADHPPGAAPAFQRAPGEVAKTARWFGGGRAFRRGFGEFGLDLLDQAIVARQTE